MIKVDESLFARRTRELMEKLRSDDGSIFTMMAPELVGFDPAEQSVTMAFPVQGWEVNPTGALNGGIITTMLDLVMGALAHGLLGRMTPTISLAVSFPRPAPGSGRVLVKAGVVMAGRAVIYTEARLWAEGSPDKAAAVCQGVFRNPED